MIRKILVTSALFLPFLVVFSQETDIQLWITANVRKDFDKKFRLYYEQGYRRDEFLSEFKTLTFEPGVLYKPWKFLWIGGYFRHYDDFKDSRKNHLTGVFLLRKNLDRFDLKSRTRYIFEFGRDINNEHFLRQRFIAGYDIPHFKINPFAATEFIFHLQPGNTETEQIRFFIGGDYKIAKHHAIEVYYRYSTEMNVKNPVNAHTIGIDYVFDF